MATNLLFNQVSPTSSTTKPPSLTCISCRMMFTSTKDQRDHYKSDYHRFNLKRKVADLPPLTLETYQEKVEIESNPDSQNGRTEWNCFPCGKTYNTQPLYKKHLKSKNHLENLQKKDNSEEIETAKSDEKIEQPISLAQIPEIANSELIEQTETMDEEEKAIEEKIKNARYFLETECIFCPHKSTDFDQNMFHMTNEHGFFIPDIEYLKDLKGLIKYLGEKISVGNVCIYCNGKGRSFHSVESVQSHMRDQCHCKMLYEEGNGGEYDDYYDFSEDYSHIPKQSGEVEEDVRNFIHSPVKVSEDGHSLIFNDGRIVGHRALNIYYKQKYKPDDTRDAVILNKLQSQYKQLGWVDDAKHSNNFEKKIRQDLHRQNISQLKLEIKANSQKFPNRANAFV